MKYWAVTPGGAFSTMVAEVWEVGSAAGMLGVLHRTGPGQGHWGEGQAMLSKDATAPAGKLWQAALYIHF